MLLEAARDGVALFGLEVASAAELSHTTIYDVMARMEEAGWLTSQWEELGSYQERRPRRRLYRLTPLGETVASREIASQLQALERARSARGRTSASGQVGLV